MSKQLVLPFKSNREFLQENFLLASCNFEAVEWISNPASWHHFGLIIYGEQGCGKSHLAKIWKKNQQGLALDYIPVRANFLSQDLQNKNLLIENLENELSDLEQREHKEEMLFHFLNHCQEEQAHLLITSTNPPKHWQINLPDLRSRLLAMPAVKIHSPGISFLSKLIEHLMVARGVKVQNGLGQFLALRVPRNFAAVHKLIDALDEEALSLSRQVTIDVAKKVLAQLGYQ